MVYKWCLVPLCKNNSTKNPQKVFLSVPSNPKRRKLWLRLARRDPNAIASHSSVYMCEDHFDMEKDIVNYMKYKMGFSKKIFVNEEAAPSKFHCQKDCNELSDAGYFQEVLHKRQQTEFIEECFQYQSGTKTHFESLYKVDIKEEIIEPQDHNKITQCVNNNTEMTSTSALECNEDLENVILVKMADVQPDRSSDVYLLGAPSVNRVTDHDYSCVFNDEDSNIGSMVSIQSEEVEDLMGTQTIDNENCKTAESSASNPGSWPTLEILPGGVIKHSENAITSLHQSDEVKEMVYACAKCPQRFKFLVNLVKHVKSHEDEQKKHQIKHHIIVTKTSKPEKVALKKTKGGKYKKYKVPKK